MYIFVYIHCYSGPADEAKVFLWWHKALQLLKVQVELGDPCGLDTLVRAMMSFQNHLAELGEERLNSGILGAIGLGRKSPLSNRQDVFTTVMWDGKIVLQWLRKSWPQVTIRNASHSWLS